LFPKGGGAHHWKACLFYFLLMCHLSILHM
jgi:hypothetical protein